MEILLPFTRTYMCDIGLATFLETNLWAEID
jgi:hypothetical protein